MTTDYTVQLTGAAKDAYIAARFNTTRGDIMKTNRQKIENLYIDWVNNFLTVERFAEYYSLTEEQANRVISTGRTLNHRRPIALTEWARLRRDYPAIERATK